MSVAIRLATLQGTIIVPVLSGLEADRASTISLLVLGLLSSAQGMDRAHKCSEVLSILAHKISEYSDIPDANSLLILRTLLQSVYESLVFVSKSPLDKSGHVSLQRTLLTIFKSALCTFGAAQVINLQSKSDEATARDLFVLIAVGSNIGNITQQMDFSRAPFAAEMVQSNLVSNLIDLFSSLDVLGQNSLVDTIATAVLQMLIILLDISEVAGHMMHSGVLNMLIESRLCLSIQKKPLAPRDDSEAHSLWLHGVLPLVLGLISRLGPRMKDDIAIFLTTYSNQIETNFASWSAPSIITKAQAEEFILLIKLTENYNSALELKDNSFSETKAYLHERINYLQSHPRWTAALIQPLEDQESVTRYLEEALDLLQKE